MQKEDEEKAKNLDIYGDLKAAAGLTGNGKEDQQEETQDGSESSTEDVTDERNQQ